MAAYSPRVLADDRSFASNKEGPVCGANIPVVGGPELIVRSITGCRIPDRFGNSWQYHSRSDRHSKLACWTIAFDLMRHCELLREHLRDGKVVLGVNVTLRDFQTQRKKDL